MGGLRTRFQIGNQAPIAYKPVGGLDPAVSIGVFVLDVYRHPNPTY